MPVEITEATIREIRAGCEGVTPGPREVATFVDGERGLDEYIRAPVPDHPGAYGSIAYEMRQPELRYLARLDPQTVAALCDDWLRMRGALAEIYEVAIPRTANPDVLLEEVEKLARSALSQATGETK